MSQNNSEHTDGESSTLPASRRQFLQAAGFAGLAGFTMAASSKGVAAAPSSASGEPGAISNLSEYIETPSMFAENQEPPHIHTSIPFDSVDGARNANEHFTELESRLDNSEYFQLLNGDWDFTWYEKPADVPDSYANTDWDSVAVPGCWQTQGYDINVYRNTQLTWERIDAATNTTPPEVPEDYNPVGTYRREFTVPGAWDGREYFLNFEGVKQAFFIWIDGEYVGYNQGSMTAAEFDITEYVSAGSDHQLTVQVYRFSDGEALETADMFRFSGIYRSVYLYSTPKVHLRDFFVRTDLDDDYEDAELSVDAELANYTGEADGQHEIKAHLFDSENSSVASFEMTATVDDSDGTTLSGNTEISDPDKWSAESPTLYTLVLDHRIGGSTTETMFDSVGFREYSIADQQFRVNGEPTEIRGVNSHEHDPEHGRTVPMEMKKKDFDLMKSYNVNALRCSHYPRDPTVYYLADEYGLYVQDEIGVETHWNQGLLGQSDGWDAQALERFRRMIQSDKNHPSIFMWSTGNEAGQHDVHEEMAEYANGQDDDGDSGTGVDPTRFLYHQDNAGGFGGGFGGDAPWADIFGPRYPSPPGMASAIASDAEPDGKPVVMGEYAHAMGNSGGLFHDFWEVIQPDAETVTDTVFRDSSDGGNDGTVVGDPQIVEEDNGAVVLDGEDDYIDIGTDSSLDFDEPGFTVWARVKDPSTEGYFSPYVTRGDQQWDLRVVEGPEVEFIIYDRENSWQSLTAPVPEGWNEGYHDVTGVATDSVLKIFVDGELLAEEPHSASTLKPSNYSYPVTVGRNSQESRFTEASFSQVRVYNQALSNAEVADARDDTSPPETAVLWIDFSEYAQNEVVREYEEYAPFQGGFVWDWVDQAVYRQTSESETDGESVRERFYDGNPFCLNGVIFEDRTVQPQLEQLKKSHQPVGVTAEDLLAGDVRITNHFQFQSLDTVDATWELRADDEQIDSGSLSLDTAPGENAVVNVPFDEPTLQSGVEYWLTLRFMMGSDSQWADAGHQIAFEEFEIPYQVPEPTIEDVNSFSKLSVTDGDDEVAIAGDGFEYMFSRSDGTLSSARYGDTETISSGPMLDFFRAPIQNELASFGAQEANEWYDIGMDDLQHDISSMEVTQPEDSVVHVAIESFVSGAGSDAGFDTQYRYKIFGSGDILLGVDVVPNDALDNAISYWLPRVGITMDVPDSFDQFEWYGKGPHETYPDRKWGAEVDVYSGSIADQFVKYQPPSDNGNKTETRWAALTNGDGVGLASFGKPELNVCLDQFENLDEADHVHELRKKDSSVTVHLDHAVTGVGGTPISVLEQYRVNVEPMTFLFGLRPFSGKRQGPPDHANNDGKKRRGPPDHANNDGKKRRGPPDHANNDSESPMELSKRRLPRDWVSFETDT